MDIGNFVGCRYGFPVLGFDQLCLVSTTEFAIRRCAMMSQALVFTLGVLFGLSEKGDGIRVRGIPTFPSGISDSVAAMGNSFQDNKPPPKDERPLINKLKETAEQVLEEEVAQELRTAEAKKAAYLLASQNVVKLVYIGGCPRAYAEPCPKGWAEASVRTTWAFTVGMIWCGPLGLQLR